MTQEYPSASGSDVDLEALLSAIGAVMDPCSVFNGTRLGLAEMGMIDDVSTDGSTVYIRLFLDDPTCIYFFEITRQLREAAALVLGVQDVQFDVKTDELWTEDRMTEHGRQRLETHRRAKSEGGTRGPLIPVVALNRGR